MEETYSLNSKTLHEYPKNRRIQMDLGAYFTTLEYILMTATFIALVLIFLYMYHGKEEEREEE